MGAHYPDILLADYSSSLLDDSTVEGHGEGERLTQRGDTSVALREVLLNFLFK